MRQEAAAAEERWVRTILKQVLITPQNYRRVAARTVPQDQREAIRPGIIISHYSFTTSGGQHGYIIVSHTTQRAGICFAKERSVWSRWSEETGALTTDSGRRYTHSGERVFELGHKPPGLGETSG